VLRDSLERAIQLEGGQVQRLGTAGTSVTFEIADAPKASVTLLLDRQPPAVADGDEPAEITIEMDSKLATSFAKGELSLPSLILSGEVSYSGPVRKYLSFDPILRSLLARVNAPGA
jgi:SCP-2 sterol transfer family